MDRWSSPPSSWAPPSWLLPLRDDEPPGDEGGRSTLTRSDVTQSLESPRDLSGTGRGTLGPGPIPDTGVVPGGSMGRHRFQSHGVSGYGTLVFGFGPPTFFGRAVHFRGAWFPQLNHGPVSFLRSGWIVFSHLRHESVPFARWSPGVGERRSFVIVPR